MVQDFIRYFIKHHITGKTLSHTSSHYFCLFPIQTSLSSSPWFRLLGYTTSRTLATHDYFGTPCFWLYLGQKSRALNDACPQVLDVLDLYCIINSVPGYFGTQDALVLWSREQTTKKQGYKKSSLCHYRSIGEWVPSLDSLIENKLFSLKGGTSHSKCTFQRINTHRNVSHLFSSLRLHVPGSPVGLHSHGVGLHSLNDQKWQQDRLCWR